MPSKILINPTDENLLYQVAHLHKENIKTGFLSSLGNDFLQCIYKSISLSKESILIVYKENDNVVGFISGTSNLKEIKEIFKRMCMFSIIKILIKLIFSPLKLKKFLEIYKYSSKNKFSQDLEAELLSIAVSPNYRGKGISQILYNGLIKFFKEKNIKEFKIIVGENLKEAQRFYEKMGAKKITEFELHKGEKSYIYIQRID